MFLNSGRNLDTGSFSTNRPSSNSIITVTLVMGLVMEAMPNMAPGGIRCPGGAIWKALCVEINGLAAPRRRAY
jgi:hypothetical protein